MNREILFRGKRNDNGEWIESCNINTQYDMYGKKHIYIGLYFQSKLYPLQKNIEWHEVDPETVGRYTGLTVNGTKLFEGDIAKADEDVYVCFWNECNYEFGFTNSKRDFGIAYAQDIEIIGNIFDNKELLEQADR